MNWLQRGALRIAGLTGLSESTHRITEQRSQADVINGAIEFSLMRESLASVEEFVRDRQWERLTTQTNQELSHDDRRRIVQQARWSYLLNPLVKRGIRLLSYYVFGRGFTVTSDDEAQKKAIDEFMALNRAELGLTGLLEKEQAIQHDGNLYFALFRDEATGSIRVRTIECLEIVDIISKPGDSSVPWYYKRVWSEEEVDLDTGAAVVNQQREAWYPSTELADEQIRQTIGSIPVERDVRIYHTKIQALPKWKFGLPDVWAAVAWARHYKESMENWLTIQASLRRFAMQVTTPGGQKVFDSIGSRLNTTESINSDRGETNPPPNTASWWIGGPNQKVQAIKTQGATEGPEQARRIGMMSGIGMGFAETMAMGDASTGSLATATSLDRPTEFMVKARQETWKVTLEALCRYALIASTRAPGGNLRTGTAQAISVRAEFPDVLEHDPEKRVGAISEAYKLGGLDPYTFWMIVLTEMGYKNPQEVLDQIYPDTTYNREDYAASTSAESAAASAQASAAFAGAGTPQG